MMIIAPLVGDSDCIAFTTDFFISAEWDFSFLASHIPGRLNNAADALSRNHVGKFFSIVSHAKTLPSHIPVSLQGLLLDQDVCWTSAHGYILFVDFCFM